MKPLMYFFMTALSVLITVPGILGESYRDIALLVLLVLFVIHIFKNRQWYFKLFSSPFTAVKIVQAAVNLFLLIALIFTVVSTLASSEGLFSFIHLGDKQTAEKIALASINWFYIFLGLHIGINFSKILPKKFEGLIKNRKYGPYLLTAGFTLALYGAFVFNTENIVNLMFLKPQQTPIFDLNLNPVLTIINYCCMLSLWIFLGHQIFKNISNLEKQNNKK